MKPLMIEIEFLDHKYVATVHNLRDLEKFLFNKSRNGKNFIFGNILSYGDLDVNQIARTMNHIRCCSGYGWS